MRSSLLLLVLCCWTALARPADLHVALWMAEAGGVATQDEGLHAFNGELAREICRRINARCLMEDVVFAEILPGIEAQRYDLGFGNFLRTAERDRRVAFSDPIWSSSSRLLGRVEHDRQLARRFGHSLTLDSVRDVRIGVVAESLQSAYLERVAAERGFRVISGKTIAEVLALLRQGRVDFCLVPMLISYDQLRHETPGSFEFVGPSLVDNGLGGTVHIALPKARDDLRQAVNQAIVALRADGTYHRLVRRNFPFSLE